MIDPGPLLKIVPIAAAAMIAPGPDFMMISSMAFSRGRRAGILAALGITMGVLVYIVLCMFGLGVVFAKMHWLVMAVRLCGGIYLTYLGIQLWRASFKPPIETGQEPTARPAKMRNPFLTGFFTNMTNPKAMAFFTSIFALTMPPDANGETRATIIIIMVAMHVFWFSFVTLGLSTPVMRKAYLQCSRWIDRVAGTFLALFGLKLMFSGQK